MKILLGKIMKENGISYRKLEAMTGIPHSTLHYIANDTVSPQMDTMELLAKGLGMKIVNLFESEYK
jgi:transcriptional regulator with XRE-family HTH domain